MKLGIILLVMILLSIGLSPTVIWAKSEIIIPQLTLERESLLFSFEEETLYKMPTGWSNYSTGEESVGKWEIRNDNGNKVLAQISQEHFGYHFDVIVFDGSEFKDVEVSLQFKGVAGEEDQGGGPVWRYRDENNYYIARANPLENNFRVYKVVDGIRRQMASADVEISSLTWHTIKIRMVREKVECYFNGKKYFEVNDATFVKSGKVGLWIKADASTYFDDMQIKNLDGHGKRPWDVEDKEFHFISILQHDGMSRRALQPYPQRS